MSHNAPRLDRRTLLGGASMLAAAAAAPTTASAQEDAAALDFSGRSVLITGTSSGFGRLSALYLGRLGATVIATMRNFDNGALSEASPPDMRRFMEMTSSWETPSLVAICST